MADRFTLGRTVSLMFDRPAWWRDLEWPPTWNVGLQQLPISRLFETTFGRN